MDHVRAILVGVGLNVLFILPKLGLKVLEHFLAAHNFKLIATYKLYISNSYSIIMVIISIFLFRNQFPCGGS